MRNIYGIKKEELIDIFKKDGIEKYHAVQVFEWLHKKKIEDIDDMSNIKKDLRERLKKDFDTDFPASIEEEKTSKIDGTKKFLIKLRDNNIVEAVLMTYEYGKSLCISTQIGCPMGCKFCASTIGGMVRNLEPEEILAEVYLIEKRLSINISNIVIMGIGEPLLNIDNVLTFLDIISDENGKNISARNITISTCGIVNVINDLSNKNSHFTLALSLHAPNDEIRKRIMPIAEKYNIDDTLKAMARYYIETKRRITIEYTLIDNVNASEDNAKELSTLLKKHFIDKHIDFNVNLIPVNEVKETNMKKPDKDKIKKFKDILEMRNINVTIRRELGTDISGSCGMLRREKL